MRRVEECEHAVVHRDRWSYCAHPHVVRCGDEWLVVFNRAPRRDFVLHPPEDPHFHNVLARSSDEGLCWSVPQVVPGYDWYGVECAGLTPLADGTVLLHQWRFRWHPLDAAPTLPPTQVPHGPRDRATHLRRSEETNPAVSLPADLEARMPWLRTDGGSYVHRSRDGGRTWLETVALDTAPFSGGYGMRGAVERPDRVLVLPLGDVPGWRRSFVVFSTDGGRSWQSPTRVAEAPGRCFNEPSAVWLRSGRLLLLLREDASGELYRTWSDDGGASWAPAVAAGISGYPPHLLVLPDDRVLCVYGHRRPPYSIRAALSRDGGESWNPDGVLVLRDGLPARDLGYPSSILRRDGRVCTVYYTQDAAGVTGIEATVWRVPG